MSVTTQEQFLQPKAFQIPVARWRIKPDRTTLGFGISNDWFDFGSGGSIRRRTTGDQLTTAGTSAGTRLRAGTAARLGGGNTRIASLQWWLLRALALMRGLNITLFS
jgi:hypothetical protein